MSALAIPAPVAPPDLPVARRTFCPGCGEIVLEVPLRGGGLTLFVETREFLSRMECPECRSGRLRNPDRSRLRKGPGTGPVEDGYFTRDVTCWRCGAAPGTKGYVGEELLVAGVAIDFDGYARPFLPGQTTRREGEAIHRAHACDGSVRAPL